jgi:hypothetical protein
MECDKDLSKNCTMQEEIKYRNMPAKIIKEAVYYGTPTPAIHVLGTNHFIERPEEALRPKVEKNL